jgi:hypothetical protein
MDERTQDPVLQVALERHLTLGTHTYRITASDSGDERIALRVLGHDPTGTVVSEISGGISTVDLPAVADVLSSTLAGLSALHRVSPGAGKPRRYPKRGTRWSTEDDERLIARHREGAAERTLMTEFGRSRAGIRARLEHLGILPVSLPPTWDGPPPAGDDTDAG